MSNTQRRISFLQLLARFISRAESEDIQFIVTTFHRTADQQHELYRQGRDPQRPGGIVTHCDGYSTLSPHQKWLAADVLVIRADGSQDWGPSPTYDRLGEIWEELGGKWGGRFTSPAGDIYHMELGVE